jgi:hypothetical protein
VPTPGMKFGIVQGASYAICGGTAPRRWSASGSTAMRSAA